jgi:CRISPR-associated protein Cas2
LIVVCCEKLPPAVRGRMKLWFTEVRCGVFVSGLNDDVALHVVEYLEEHCKAETGLLIFLSRRKAPGFEVRSKGSFKDRLLNFGGLQLLKVE